jgi:hypothetical protein
MYVEAGACAPVARAVRSGSGFALLKTRRSWETFRVIARRHVADEDWRLRVAFDDPESLWRIRERVEACELERGVVERLGRRVVVSRDGSTLFAYADSETAVREAQRIVTSIASKEGWRLDSSLARWHADAEDWEPAAKALPATDEQRGAERDRLMRREDQEAADRGYPDWEIRAEFDSHRDAREFAQQLDSEEIPNVRRWKYLLVGAADEDAAEALRERLRREAPPATRVAVEGTFAAVARSNPFAFIGAFGGT